MKLIMFRRADGQNSVGILKDGEVLDLAPHLKTLARIFHKNILLFKS